MFAFLYIWTCFFIKMETIFSRIINLKSRPDRWNLVSNLGIDRFDAVSLTSNYDASLHLSLRAKTEFQAGRRTTEGIPSKGAVGCSLSHISLWREFLKSNKNYCLILEDDCVIKKNELEKDCLQLIKNNFDIALLGYGVPLGIPLHRRPDQSVIPWPQGQCFYGSHAYMLTRKSAEILLLDALPIQMQIDFYIQAVASDRKLHIITSKHRIRQSKSLGTDIMDNFCLTCEPIWIKLGFTLLSIIIIILVLTSHQI